VDGEEVAKSHTVYDLIESLTFSENLRKRRREGEQISFVTSVSEYQNVVGEMGVAETGEDYNWTKRRDGRHPRKQKGSS
jgi:2',3'-cyclic-nucleotide 2'-phosphodiesterase (5'-nucleotidase family)